MIGTVARALVVSVQLHDSRYYGLPEWPPAPSRLFQALVAGVATGGLSDGDRAALAWLELLNPPVIGSPIAGLGQGFRNYVPNNDLDAVGGDTSRASKIKAEKWIKPRLLNGTPTFVYVWQFPQTEDDERHARRLCVIANHLYQFGRGVDMAWACGELMGDEQLAARVEGFAGRIHRPSNAGNGEALDCPRPGSLRSLEDRYRASTARFKSIGQGTSVRQVFSQPPKPRFEPIPYDSHSFNQVYELHSDGRDSSFAPWPLARAAELVVALRDGAVQRLKRAVPDRSDEIECVLVGRKADGADAGPIASRVRIVPLPSIGHQHVDRRIRRVLVEVPSECPIKARDVFWAFSGLDVSSRETGEILAMVTPSDDDTMLDRFVATGRVWSTVTPAALPGFARRRRIEPTRIAAEVKGGGERADEEARAAGAVVQALRHADVRVVPDVIRVQREPFDRKGERAEAFAPTTRFEKERLWHVEITFATPVPGPLIIGDGRFLGLGVMAPAQRGRAIYAFIVEGGLVESPQPTEVARALRRAVMARVQDVLGTRRTLSSFFSGHEPDGSPARTEHPHLTFAFDPTGRRLLILAPNVVDRKEPSRGEVQNLTMLEAALAAFRELRAGAAGRLTLRATVVDQDTDSLFAASRNWECVTPYVVTRHLKQVDAAEVLAADIRAECRLRGLPEPRVISRELQGVPGMGLTGFARLAFDVAISGPLILGRTRHLGGGLFAGAGR